MRADRQTDGQTDILITIFRTSLGASNNDNDDYNNQHNSDDDNIMTNTSRKIKIFLSINR